MSDLIFRVRSLCVSPGVHNSQALVGAEHGADNPSKELSKVAEIIVPKRKKRDELSILKALSSTVKKVIFITIYV